MSRWYRAYEGTCADPKLHEAAEVAGVSRSVVIAVWHLLLESCASENGVGEYEIPPRRVAVVLGESTATIETVLSALGEVGLINDGCVPNWGKRQFISDRDPTNAERQARFRANRKTPTATVTNETPEADNVPVTESNGPVTPPIDIDRYREEHIRSPRRTPDRDFEKDFEIARLAYPKREGTDPRKTSFARYIAARRKGATADEILAGIGNYADDMRRTSKEGTPFVKQFSAWLNQELWRDYAPRSPPPEGAGWNPGMPTLDELRRKYANAQ